jgi:hypothetical protein
LGRLGEDGAGVTFTVVTKREGLGGDSVLDAVRLARCGAGFTKTVMLKRGGEERGSQGRTAEDRRGGLEVTRLPRLLSS